MYMYKQKYIITKYPSTLLVKYKQMAYLHNRKKSNIHNIPDH